MKFLYLWVLLGVLYLPLSAQGLILPGGPAPTVEQRGPLLKITVPAECAYVGIRLLKNGRIVWSKRLSDVTKDRTLWIWRRGAEIMECGWDQPQKGRAPVSRERIIFLSKTHAPPVARVFFNSQIRCQEQCGG